MTSRIRRISRFTPRTIIATLATTLIATNLHGQTPATPTSASPAVPDWAKPASATHKQVPPPPDFHRPATTIDTPIGIFDGQSDVGSAVVPGSAAFDTAAGVYTVNSAGYNIWYNRDEFRFLWKKLSGDVTLSADVSFPTPVYTDRKAVIIIRQSLDDDSKEILAGLHGTGMLQFAQRPEKNAQIVDIEYRIGGRGIPAAPSHDGLIAPQRIGIEKRGDFLALLVSVQGEPLHQFGPPIQMHFDGPFYIGIGFCSHVPDKVDTAVFTNVTLETPAKQAH